MINVLYFRWLDLSNKDREDPSKVTYMGSLCVSIQIWPKEMALLQPVGIGQNAPNTNPYLPPPIGRFYFTW